MANNQVTFQIDINGNAYNGIMDIGGALDEVLGSVHDVSSQFDTLGSQALKFDAITNVIGKISDGFKSLVGSSLEFETQQANIRTLLNGDAEATENLVRQIREYGSATVYDRGSLVEAQKTMMAFGMDAEYAFSKLKNIGDIALGDKQKMGSLALAFAQASSTGKLMGQDFLQMVNAGFNPLEVISQKTGKSMADLKDEMSKGQISADLLAQSFEWATEEGGRFYRGAEMAAETTAGKIAKIQGAIDDMKVSLFEATGGATAYLAELGDMITPLTHMLPLFSMAGNGITTLRSKVLTLIPANMAAGFSFQTMGEVAKSVCKGIGNAIMSIPIVGWIAAAIAAIIAIVKLLWDNSERFRQVVFGVWEVINAAVSNTWTVISTVVGLIWNGLLKPLFEWIAEVVQERIALWMNLFNTISELVSKAVDWIKEKFFSVVGFMSDYVAEPIKEAFAKAWDFIKGIFDKMLDKLSELFRPIREFWNKLFPEDTFENLGDAWKRGVEKGSESWANDHKGKDISVLGGESKTPGQKSDSPLSGGKLGSTAGTSAGQVKTINIKLGSMVQTMNFNGGLRENATDVESILAEQMARILGMAETAM